MKTALLIVGQIVAGYLLAFLAFLGMYGLGIGGGFEVVAFPVFMSLGVWGVGVLADPAVRNWKVYSWTLGLSALGSLLLNFLVTGFAGILLPLIGALIGYWWATKKS